MLSCDIFGQIIPNASMQINRGKKQEKTLLLAGRRILITRAQEQAEEFSHLLQSYGAHVVAFPTIEIVPPNNWGSLDEAIERLDTYDWVIFTSVNGVKFFTQRLKEKKVNITVLAEKKLCAIGPRTQEELEKLGLKVTFMPTEYRAEGVIEGLKATGIKGQRILLPRAWGARKVLPEALRQAGAVVDEVEVYRAVRPAKIKDSVEAILSKGIDVVTFTSSSTVRNFMELVSNKTIMNGVKVAVIGPITAETVRTYGLEPAITSAEYTIPRLVEAIVEHFTQPHT